MVSIEKQIDILLEEYRALRSEVELRLRQRMLFLSLFGGIGTGVFFGDPLTNMQRTALIAAALFCVAIWLQLGNLVIRLSDRISEIETGVNERAEVTLMRWEHERRGSPLMHRFHR